MMHEKTSFAYLFIFLFPNTKSSIRSAQQIKRNVLHWWEITHHSGGNWKNVKGVAKGGEHEL